MFHMAPERSPVVTILFVVVWRIFSRVLWGIPLYISFLNYLPFIYLYLNTSIGLWKHNSLSYLLVLLLFRFWDLISTYSSRIGAPFSQSGHWFINYIRYLFRKHYYLFVICMFWPFFDYKNEPVMHIKFWRSVANTLYLF